MNDLEKIQNISYQILCYIDSFCKKYNIEYFLYAGTCLGAIRHNGFIPWDDDIDICMKRDDYIRFINLFSKHNENCIYKVSSVQTDKKWGLPFAKVWDSRTYKEYTKLELPVVGIDVDIFPIDGTPNNSIMRQVVYFVLKIINVCKNASIRKEFESNSKFKLLKNILNIIFNKIEISNFINLMEKISERYKYDNSNTVGTYLCFKYGVKEFFNKNIFSSYVMHKFGDNMFPIPVGYNEMLKQLYGNYMIPVVENGNVNGTHTDYCIVKFK